METLRRRKHGRLHYTGSGDVLQQQVFGYDRRSLEWLTIRFGDVAALARKTSSIEAQP